MNAIAIGEQLKTAREARGLSIDYVASETNIAKRYIAAMENEDFSVFPGEPYIIGFLRNYADYLGLESAGIVQAFRGIRIQEQPVPLQELLQPRRVRVWPFIAIGAVLLLAAGAFAAYKLLAPAPGAAPPALATAEPTQHTLDAQVYEKRFYKGDTLLVPYAGDSYKITIEAIDERVALATPIGVSRFMLGEEGSIDLDKDNQPEIIAFVVDFQKNEPSRGAMIRFSAAGSLATAMAAGSPPAVATAGDSITPEVGATTGAASTAPERPSTQEAIVFSGKRSPHPFVINVTFRNYAMFRHEIDRSEREERYYHKGDQISVTANNSAKLWASNAAACKLTIQASGGQSADIELGAPGEVAVKQVRWSQGDDGAWNLGVYDVN